MSSVVITSRRSFTAVARAERGGRTVCAAVLLVVEGAPGRLGLVPVDDLTAWFYGALDPGFELELEGMADAERGAALEPELAPVDLVVQAPGGELRLEGCRVGAPVRVAGPASTLEYRISHAPVAAERHLRLVA